MLNIITIEDVVPMLLGTIISNNTSQQRCGLGYTRGDTDYNFVYTVAVNRKNDLLMFQQVFIEKALFFENPSLKKEKKVQLSTKYSAKKNKSCSYEVEEFFVFSFGEKNYLKDHQVFFLLGDLYTKLIKTDSNPISDIIFVEKGLSFPRKTSGNISTSHNIPLITFEV